jgi:hypothetical protein
MGYVKCQEGELTYIGIIRPGLKKPGGIYAVRQIAGHSRVRSI